MPSRQDSKSLPVVTSITGRSLCEALAVVGATEEEFIELLGSTLTMGPSYIVGSLAAGLGNLRSGIDIHVIDEQHEAPGAEMLFFLRDTSVDVVYYQPEDLEATKRLLPDVWVDFGGGGCSLGTSFGAKQEARFARWTTALPINTDLGPPLASFETAAAAAVTRCAVETHLRISAIAHLATRAERPSDVVAGLWRRAGVSLLEAACRARGELHIGVKWIWSKAARLNIADETLRAVDGARSSLDVTRCAELLGLPPIDPLAVVQLDPADNEPLEVAGTAFLLLDGGRVVGDWAKVSGVLGAEIDRAGPAEVLAAIAYGTAQWSVNESALDRELQ